VFHPDNKLKTKSENHIGYNTDAIKCAEKENYIAENQLKNETENIVLDFTVKKPEQNYYFKSVIADESIKLSTMCKSFKENILQPCEIVHAHKDEKFSCKFCGKSFATRAIVKRHEKIHALSPLERSYPCNFCGLRYMNKQSAINHQEQNCPIKGQLQDIHLNAQIASPNLEKVGNDYICMYKSCLFTNIHKEVKLFSILQIGIQKLKLLISIHNIKDASKPVTEKIYAKIQNSTDLKKVNSNNDNKFAYCGEKVPKIEANGHIEACKKVPKNSKDIEVINGWTVIKFEPLKSIKLETLKSIKLEPLKSIKPEPLENSESLDNVKKEDI
jgi:hypothetical protein